MTAEPYDKRGGFIWVDGKFVPWEEANVHILNQGLHYASSVFEGERAYGGRIFRSKDHTRRLFHSANRLAMDLDFTQTQIEDAKREALERSGLDAAYLRPVVWRGSQQMGISVQNANVHVAIAVWKWGDYFSDKLSGIKLTVANWRRPPPEVAPVDAKAAGLYMICTLAKKQAEDNGFADALMLDCEYNIAEATGANIFLVRDGEIHTPLPTNFLNGITRQTVIQMASSAGYVVKERIIPFSELGSFSECFITGSAAEITPVSQIDYFSFSIGDITHDIVARYTKAVNSCSAHFPSAVVKGHGVN